MKRTITFLIIIIFIFKAGFSFAQKKITVAVAANMQYAFNDLKNEFEKSTKIHVNEVIGASGNLSHQIMQGAPFDVFLSADTAYVQKLFEKGFTSEKPKVYARGLLVLSTAVPGLKPSADLQFLLSPKIKAIAMANPRTAPYGLAAEAVLKKYKLLDKLKNKIVYGESISQTSQFIATQNADVGFTAKAIVLSKSMKEGAIWIEINQADYPPILQSAVLLNYGMENHPTAAKKFYEFLYSENARIIYKKYGYLN